MFNLTRDFLLLDPNIGLEIGPIWYDTYDPEFTDISLETMSGL